MNTYKTNGRKNGSITALAAAVAALGLAATPRALATTTDTNNWIGPAGNGSQGGDWGTAANWSTGWVPGSNTTIQDSTVNINNSSTTTPYTVTVSESLSGDNNMSAININAGIGPTFGTPTSPAPVTVEVQSGGYLATTAGGNLTISNHGVNGTLNLDGGTVYVNNGGVNVGGTLSYPVPGSATGTLDVSAGTIYSGRSDGGGSMVVGEQSTGVVNLSSTGTININTTPSGTATNAGLILGATAPTTVLAKSNGNGLQVATTYLGTGTVNQTGGTMDVARAITVGDNAAGNYYFSGGTITVGQPSNSTLQVGVNAAGLFDMTRGTANLGNINVGGDLGNTSNHPNGLLEISGGSLTANNNNPYSQGVAAGSNTIIGNADNVGTGTLEVIGNLATITLDSGAGHPALATYANSTLDFQIGSSGVSTIQTLYDGSTSTQGDGRGILFLAGTLQLGFLGGFTPAKGTTYTLITSNEVLTGTTAIDDSGLSLAPADQGLWTIGLLNTSAATELQATYIGASPPIPEPSSLALLATTGAGLLLAARRRRRA